VNGEAALQLASLVAYRFTIVTTLAMIDCAY
jgi:hypothetical protein